jgi:tRNA A37 threonylcarbamoyladenosine dehydratase
LQPLVIVKADHLGLESNRPIQSQKKLGKEKMEIMKERNNEIAIAHTNHGISTTSFIIIIKLLLVKTIRVH